MSLSLVLIPCKSKSKFWGEGQIIQLTSFAVGSNPSHLALARVVIVHATVLSAAASVLAGAARTGAVAVGVNTFLIQEVVELVSEAVLDLRGAELHAGLNAFHSLVDHTAEMEKRIER